MMISVVTCILFSLKHFQGGYMQTFLLKSFFSFINSHLSPCASVTTGDWPRIIEQPIFTYVGYSARSVSAESGCSDKTPHKPSSQKGIYYILSAVFDQSVFLNFNRAHQFFEWHARITQKMRKEGRCGQAGGIGGALGK